MPSKNKRQNSQRGHGFTRKRMKEHAADLRRRLAYVAGPAKQKPRNEENPRSHPTI